jgi:hypothetical protein
MYLLPRRIRTFSEKYLSPEERLSEILFGQITVLTITSTTKIGLSEVEMGLRTMIFAAVGCNVAWGIVDGVMYVLEDMFTRARYGGLVSNLRSLDENKAFTAVEHELGPTADLILDEVGKKRVYSEVIRSASELQPEKVRVSRDGVFGAFACFLLVFSSTFPVLIPFIFVPNLGLATRMSNLVAIAMLFSVGHEQARYTNQNGLRTGLVMVIIGSAIVGVTILLGG